MAFSLGAFAAGFAEATAKGAEEKNKKIRTDAVRELEKLVEEAQETEEKFRTKREKLKTTAEVLSSYRGANNSGFTPTQIISLLQNEETAKKMISTLQENKTGLENIDFKKLWNVEDKQTDMSIDDFIKQSTTIQQPPAQAKPEAVVMGPFGRPSREYKRVQQDFEARTGKTISELRATARGQTELAAEPIVGTFDFSQFKKPEGIEAISNRLADNIANGQKFSDPENQRMLNQLVERTNIKRMLDPEGGEGGKPRTAAQINGVFDKSLRVGLEPFITKGIVRIEPTTGEFIPISGSAEHINSFMQQRNKIVEARAREMGILDKDNNVIGGRNSTDALLPYAEIKDGKAIFRTATTVTPSDQAPGTAAPAAPAKPAAVTDKPIPIPKTAIVDGKLDATKLVPGQKYMSSDGKVRTWNGMGWQ